MWQCGFVRSLLLYITSQERLKQGAQRQMWRQADLAVMLQACPVPEDIDSVSFVMQHIAALMRQVFEVDARGVPCPASHEHGRFLHV